MSVTPCSRRNLINSLIRKSCDQATILADFADTTIQDRADEAIHRFVAAAR